MKSTIDVNKVRACVVKLNDEIKTKRRRIICTRGALFARKNKTGGLTFGLTYADEEKKKKKMLHHCLRRRQRYNANSRIHTCAFHSIAEGMGIFYVSLSKA